MSLNVTDNNFNAIKDENTVMLDFFAQWCGPCRIAGPMIDEVAKEFEGQAVVAKIDVDENPDLVTQFGIKSIPTVIFLKEGVEVERQTGTPNKKNLVDKIKSYLK